MFTLNTKLVEVLISNGVFICSKFFTAVICNYIYIHIIHFQLYHSVNIYSNWLQEQFCNFSLYTLYILSVK